jgi:DUF1680 family protein
VYCAESVDLPDGVDLDDVVVDSSARPIDHGGQVVAQGFVVAGAGSSNAWPYRSEAETSRPSSGTPVEIRLSPYHQWAERKPTSMRVWLPVSHPHPAYPG